MKELRLDKYLCDLGYGTRTEVKNAIKKGRVRVDGITAKRPEMKVNDKTEVSFDGKLLSYDEFEYYMLYKPEGCVSATEDRKQKTVLDYIDSDRKDLFPVGRLDIDSEGLLLITNDGMLAHKLLSPRRSVEKTYYAKIKGIVSDSDVAEFKMGLDIGDEKPTLPAKLEILISDTISEIYVTIIEGRFHEVKRMFEAVDKEVLYLKRVSMGPLKLDETLTRGESRKLTEEELHDLKCL